MGLTNIKPCVECAHETYCNRRCEEENLPRALVRINAILCHGEDCFEEVDDGRVDGTAVSFLWLGV